MKTMSILEASTFLGAHKETIRRLVISGKIPVVKIGKGWRFIKQDFVLYMHSEYSHCVTSQGAMKRSNEQWRFTKEIMYGGLASPTMDKEYNEALALKVK